MIIKSDKDKEKSIIDAATKLFLDKGYAATSTTEIAREVGCNQALVHYYFRTKERLFEAVFAEKFQEFVKGILEINEVDLGFEEKLRLRIESHFDMLYNNPKLPMLIAYELNTNPARLEAMKNKLGDLPKIVFASFQEELENEIALGNIRPISIIDLIYSMLALNISIFLIGPIMKSFVGLSDDTYEKLVIHRRKENVDLLINSLRP